MEETQFKEMLSELVFELNKNNITIGTSEHCTCGLVGATIASIANLTLGKKYRGSIVTNCDDNLINLLDVSPNAIKNNGVVSSQVACQMAVGGLYKMNVDLCIAIVGDIKSGVVWLCTARQGEKVLDFRYKQLLLENVSSNSEKYNKVIEEAIEIALLHVEEKNNG